MSVRQTLRDVLEQEGLPFEELEGRDLVRLAFVGAHGRWAVLAQWSAADDHLSVFSVAPMAVPPDRRPAVSELVLRVNFGLRVGSFDLDLDDGELRFRTSQDFEGVAVEPALVRACLLYNLAAMDHHFEAVHAVISGRAPSEALRAPSPGTAARR